MTPALVVGLLPAQADRVRRALGHRYRLKFVTSDKAKALKHTKEVNVVLLDYTCHKGNARIAKLLRPGQTLLRVRGLEKNVITALENHQ
jgi:hypothetical protein